MTNKEMIIKNQKKKTAFTLIELLAVIIILGVLMIIAVPSVTKYIEDSRKSGYVSTAKELAGGARALIHSGNLNLTDKDTTYYIDSNCIDSSNGAKTPYGELTKAYVVVNYTDEGYEYYWISVDSTGTGVKKITNLEELDTDSIERDITEADILNNLGVDARHNYVIISEENGCSIGTVEEAPTRVDSNGNTDVIDYPVGKNKRTLEIGDLIKIGNEEFYLIAYSGNDTVLMSRYNLKVGIDADGASGNSILKTYTSSDSGYGLQSSDCIGYDSNDSSKVRKCVIKFSETLYWHNQLGEGKKYPDNYVYDSNSSLYPYIENYKSYLEGLGANIKEARILNPAKDFADSNISMSIVTATSYWIGHAVIYDDYDGYIGTYYYPSRSGIVPYMYNVMVGIRPVIVI